MRIDIIVPNFDSSSDEVVLSAWYKKVGEKISKNEIIADAETPQIACGITSSYDCILAKILVKEGETISQGSKIAVIETNLNATMDKEKQLSEVEELKKESAELEKAIEKDVEHQLEKEAEEVKEEIAKLEEEEAELRIEEAELKAEEEAANEVTEEIISEDSEGNVVVEVESKNYSFSVPEEEIKDDLVLNVNEAETVEEKIEEAEELATELVEEKILDDFTERADEKVSSILKEAESKAKEEAAKLKTQIIDDAKKQALVQAEETKKRIIKEYEEKAAHDASEMHKKIVQGSITEAEIMKAKLLNEAKERAQKDAEILRASILEEAKKNAQNRAKEIEKEAIENTRMKSGEISKDIIENSIREAKTESKAIKKNIIRSANKFAVKESTSIIRQAIKEAGAAAHEKTQAIFEGVVSEVSHNAEIMKLEILKSASEELKNLISNTITDTNKKLVEFIKNNISSSVHDISTNLNREVKEEADFALKKLIAQVNSEIMGSVKTIMKEISYDANHKIKNSVVNIVNELIEKENKSIKNDVKVIMKDISENISNKFKDSFKTAIKKEPFHSMLKKSKNPDTNNEAIDEANSFVRDISEDIQKDIKEKMDSINNVPLNQGYEVRYSLDPRSCQDESYKDTKLAEKIVEEEVEKLKDKEFANILINNAASPDMDAETWNKPQYFASPEDESVPIDFLKQRINEKLKASLESSVISTVSNEVDMSAILTIEKTFGEEFSKKYNTRLGFTPFFILGSISALKEYRVFNAHIRGNDIIYKNTFDISVITCGNDGIMAPVIRHADKLSIADIEKQMITLSKRAIEGSLSVEEVSGGTFTVVNAGVYGSLMGTDLLTPPQVATLSVHRMHNRPIATDTGVEVRPMLYISLSYDHRIADTKQAAEFLEKVKKYVENPGWSLLDL